MCRTIDEAKSPSMCYNYKPTKENNTSKEKNLLSTEKDRVEERKSKGRLNDEINELITKQKVTLREDFEVARKNKENPTTPLCLQNTPAHCHKLKVAVVSSNGDLEGAEDEEACDIGSDGSFTTDNINEARVSTIQHFKTRRYEALVSEHSFSSK